MSDFPDMVYRVPGLHATGGGETFSFLGVNSQDELDAALADGWYKTLPEAIDAYHAPDAETVIAEVSEAQDAVDDMSPATRDELEQKARELGVSFNSRTSDAVLAKRIAEAL